MIFRSFGMTGFLREMLPTHHIQQELVRSFVHNGKKYYNSLSFLSYTGISQILFHMFHSVSSQDFSSDLLIDEVGDVVLAIAAHVRPQMVPLYNIGGLARVQGKGAGTWNIHSTSHSKVNRIRA